MRAMESAIDYLDELSAGFLSRSVNLSATRLQQLFNIETAVRGASG